MGLFDILFPKEAAQRALYARRVRALLERAGLDAFSDPDLEPVIKEMRAGRDIKATQIYCEAKSAGVGEGYVAIAEFKRKLTL